MKEISIKNIFSILKEEFDESIRKSLDEIDAFSDDGKLILSSGLKVWHIESGMLYTIDEIAPDHIDLRKPDGDLFRVKIDEFEKNYTNKKKGKK